MLARRFAIVCLMTMIFGMGFSAIVAETSRGRTGWDGQRVSACVPDFDGSCRFQRI